MDPVIALIVVVAVLIVLLCFDLPVALVLAASGVCGVLLIDGVSVTGNVLGRSPYEAVAGYSLVVIPMFVLLGMFALRAGLSSDVFAVADRVLRRLPGGLGIATVAACAGFAAVTGSSVATVATLGGISVTEMRKAGYTAYFAAAIVGSAGTLGILIPPSIGLVLFGIISGESVAQLLIAGVIPGIFSAVAVSCYVMLAVWRNPLLVNVDSNKIRVAGGAQSGVDAAVGDSSKSVGAHEPTEKADFSWPRGIWSVVQIGVLFAIVIGGIYSGVFTATESGAIAAFVALCFVALRHWRSVRSFGTAVFRGVQDSLELSSMVFAMMIGASIFTFFLVSGRVPIMLTEWVVGLDVHPVMVACLLLLAMIPIGMFLDSISMTVIAVPLIYPAITALGFDGIWLGIVFVKMVEIGLITPPVGTNGYVAAGTAPGLKAEGVFRALLPFVVVDLVIVAILFLFPQIVTWLPSMSS